MSNRRRFCPMLQLLEDRCVPATFTVKNLLDDGSASSLRGAIEAANLTAAADTIVFKDGLEGTIRLTSGEIAITSNLTVLGPGAAKIAASGQFASRIFNIDSAGDELSVKLQGLELRNGLTGDTGGAILSAENLTLTKMALTFNQAGTGGAISCAGNLTVTKSNISGNSAGDGGGIYCLGSSTISRSTISGNSAGSSGGGIFCGSATIISSTISSNAAVSNGGGISCSTAMITGSTISGNAGANFGGGIFSFGQTTIAGSTISGNAGGLGGGIYCDQTVGAITITGCTISGNTSSTNGGGFFSQKEVTITGSTIADNIAGTAGLGHGGGIFCRGGTISGSTVSGNTTASEGGGIYAFVSSLASITSIRNCTVSGNRAGSNGGGVALTLGSSSEIRNCTISGNRAVGNGGGAYSRRIYGSGAILNVDNCTISGNRAATDGGGIFHSGGLWGRNCTIAFNQAVQTGGGINGGSSLLESCLLADNTAGTGGKDLAALVDVISLDHCFISNYADGDATLQSSIGGGSISTASPGNNLLNTDALLAPLALNGGNTQTHALKKGSLAINAGSNSAGLTTDQRGAGFKRKLGPAVDIGAFERQ